MKISRLVRSLGLVVTIALVTAMVSGAVVAEDLGGPAIDPEEFRFPGMEYRPGVRWWWPGGAVEPDELVREIDLLVDNGFGYAEINPFGGGLDNQYGDKAPYEKYGTDEYYAALEAAVARAAVRGFTIDLNMGSGWNANGPFVPIGWSMGNMAIGRDEIDISASDVGVVQAVRIPEVVQAQSYQSSELTIGGIAELQALVIARVNGKLKDAITQGTLTGEPTEDQILYDPSSVSAIDLSGSFRIPGSTCSWIPEKQGTYAVISIYSVPTGCRPIDSVNKEDGFVIDHMDKAIAAWYMETWMGDGSRINEISRAYPGTIRAYFNDSYEFYGDAFYNTKLYKAAKDGDNNILGYDLTPYLPTIYKVFSAWPHYRARGLATNDLFYAPSTPEPVFDEASGVFDFAKDSDVVDRITYDYQLLVNQGFQAGMKGFQEKANEYGALYRQQAYNPPIDTIGSAKYVDIPEGEQLNENTLKRVSSGAHLYNRPLVTAEQYTLGCTPFRNTLEDVKNGFDLMAVSGVNNFFYHGFNYRYFGNETMQNESAYGETGYSAFFGIGINVGEANSLWPYFKDLNAYASRLNYLMQQGSPSSDVALYMPFNGSLNVSEGAAKELNENGFAWDAINDDAIRNMVTWDAENEVIRISGSDVVYKAIIVQDTSVPVETMRALKALAAEGAPVVFYGTRLPLRHPGFAGGAFADLDSEVSSISDSMVKGNEEYPRVTWATNAHTLISVLDTVGKISYEKNADVRFVRRALSDGGELAFFRNMSAVDANTVVIKVASDLKNGYWLDQNTGKIYRAEIVDGRVTMTLPPLGAITLLCEPEGVRYSDRYVEEGSPMVLDTRPLRVEASLDEFTLAVTADNIGTYRKGAFETRFYTENALGNWVSDMFHDGDLKYVNAPGIYRTTLTIEDMSVYDGRSCYLDLGEVHTAAEVTVNGRYVGTLIYSPYKLDISEYLQQGENAIEIKVTPRTYNRYIGFRHAYDNTTGKEQQTYQYYRTVSETGRRGDSNWVDAGLIGPVTFVVTD